MLRFLCTVVVTLLLSAVALAEYKVPPIPLGGHAASYGHPASSSGKYPRAGYVTTSNGNLYLNGKLFNIRSMNAPNLFGGTDFSTIDTMKTFRGLGSPATRTYVIVTVVNSQFNGSSSIGLVTGWDDTRQDWVYNETMFKKIDLVLARAAESGVKLIIPFFNQDYGTAGTDWVGNTNDLVRIRYNIANYTEAQAIDTFTDMEMRGLFKNIITYILTRVNTVNGRVYGHDDCVLAWETGNEMNWASNHSTVHMRPAPANWTIDIAKHIKSLAPNTLVMDGSYSRNGIANESFPIESLESEYVDLFSYHYYGDGDQALFAPQNAYVSSFGKPPQQKVLMVTEHGFYSTGPKFEAADVAYLASPCVLVWSMRPHSVNGGFLTHSEGDGIFSYHFPGWQNQTDPNFDPREGNVSLYTYRDSWTILTKPVPVHPVPGRPALIDVSNATHKAVSWQGAAWAYSYELWAASITSGFKKVGSGLLDNVGEGKLFVPVDPSNSSLTITMPKLPIEPNHATKWVDTKWSDPLPGHQHRKRIDDDIVNAIKNNVHDSKNVAAPNSSPTTSSNTNSDVSLTLGTWYLLRGVSVEGTPGMFSDPLLIFA